jgi:hypothetical protein
MRDIEIPSQRWRPDASDILEPYSEVETNYISMISRWKLTRGGGPFSGGVLVFTA